MKRSGSESPTDVPEPYFHGGISIARLPPAPRPSAARTTSMATTLFNFTLGGDPLSLDRIRGILTRLEDTIIFALIERAQFAHNPKAYQRGAFPELKAIGFEGSWLDWFLKETETFQGARVVLCHNFRANRGRACDSQSEEIYQVRPTLLSLSALIPTCLAQP